MADSLKQVRTRFAPSPTGFLHIGNFRTALFGFLFARGHDGTNILRLEDTDQNRKIDGAIEYLLRVMKVMNVTFDEGYYLDNENQIVEKGEYGPYLQSQRLGIYKEYAEKLLESGAAYYCFCTPERL